MGTGKLNGALRIRILERDGYSCVYCGRRPPQVALEVDHVLPRAHGGGDEATNLVTACFDCNNGKRDGLLKLPDYVVLAPLAAGVRPRPPAHGSGWRREAELRWPDGMDMLDLEYHEGRYVTVTWCAGLLIHFHSTVAQAANSGMMAGGFCGHECWHDHELVDLAVPEVLHQSRERARGWTRVRHFRECQTCSYTFSGQGVTAAITRMQDRIARATA